jgi:hypothetical protein
MLLPARQGAAQAQPLDRECPVGGEKVRVLVAGINRHRRVGVILGAGASLEPLIDLTSPVSVLLTAKVMPTEARSRTNLA